MTADNGMDREAVRRRAEAATPGPWKPWTTDDYPSVVYFENGASFRVAVCSGWSNNAADAEFIAHARADVPALLDALEAAEARLAAIESAAWAAVRAVEPLSGVTIQHDPGRIYERLAEPRRRAPHRERVVNAKPKVRHSEWDEGLVVIPSSDFLWVECEVSGPPSAAGRTVYVLCDQDAEERLFNLLKRRAIARRRMTIRESEEARRNG